MTIFFAVFALLMFFPIAGELVDGKPPSRRMCKMTGKYTEPPHPPEAYSKEASWKRLKGYCCLSLFFVFCAIVCGIFKV